MAQVINTNINSLVAQRNLTRSGASLGVSIERLSSGLRINSARDDAAGLAISERMTGKLRSMEVAKRNANDGISGLQVADGVLASISDNLQRMRELATQAATGTISQSDRANLDLEFSQLSEEIERLSGTAEFNGVKLLQGNGNGGNTEFEIQIGADGEPTDNQLKIQFTNILAEIEAFQETSADLDISAGAFADVADVTLASLDAGTAPAALSQREIDAGFTPANTLDYDLDGDGNLDTRVYNDGTNALAFASLTGEGLAGESTDIAGTVAIADVTLGNLGVASQTSADNAEAFVKLGNASIKFTAADDGSIFETSNGERAVNGVDGDNAQRAITALGDLLDDVNNQRATLGAGINRLEAVISNLDSNIVNLSAARGRIVDADFAKETANLTRTQILQQAGTAVLAQANQLPTSVLGLLG